MKDAILTLIREDTPDSEGIVEIQSRYGTKRISSTRFAEITIESWRLGRRARGGTEEECRKIFNRLIEEEVNR